jgi:hypothetical protein
MFNKIVESPIFIRAMPFVAFAALTLFQGNPGDASHYWIVLLKTGIGAGLLYAVRPHIKELKWNFSWESAAVGILIFSVWVGLDGCYPTLGGRPKGFNPVAVYGAGSAMAFIFIAFRMIGSSLIVPPLEEIFFRSFLYRYLIREKFLEIPLNRFQFGAFVVSGVVFGIGHYEWLPGILCAFAYQWLVCRKGRLGDAITAHAITNFLLAVWAVNHQAYHFW